MDDADRVVGRQPTPVICVLGPPGSGKTATSEALGVRTGVNVVHGGRMLRTLMQRSPRDVIAVRAEQIAKTGQPIPTDMYCRLVSECIQRNGRWLVLDGYPRSTDQYEALPAVCRAAGVSNPSLFGVFLIIDSAEQRDRILTRRRSDDVDPELVERRMRLYTTNAYELESRFRSDAHTVSFSGLPAPAETADRIVNFVNLVNLERGP